MAIMWSILLLILTRDGVLHHNVDGAASKLAPAVEKPQAMVVVHDAPLVVAVAHARGLLEVAGKQHPVPGKQDDLVQLGAAAGALYGLTRAHALVTIDEQTGKRTPVATWPRSGLLAGGVGIHDGVVEVLGDATRKWPVTGTPIAAAATGERVFFATREGPLWQVDLATGRKRDLGLGSWWGALAMAAQGTHVYVATQSGKLWDIDIAAGTKTAVAMEGWQNTIALAATP
jgi:hypothetical protein